MILKYIKGRGKATCKMIQKEFYMSESMAYRRLRLMVNSKYLISVRRYQDMPGDYFLTDLGTHILKDFEQQNSNEILVEDIPEIRWRDVLFLRGMGVTHLPADTTKSQALKIAKKIFAERKSLSDKEQPNKKLY